MPRFLCRIGWMGRLTGVWLILLTSMIGAASSAGGQVRYQQKISAAKGGFIGGLLNDDRFGVSTTSLGDLDGDGVGDVAVGAYWDDRSGAFRGAVWILFLNPDGSVKSHQKIAPGQGGFSGVLDVWDEFGVSVACVGDHDGDGVNDLAVGARLDDDGNANSGAVWFIFLNNDGTVKAHQKISNTTGGFTGVLETGAWFGSSVAAIGDLDGDSISDLAVGAPNDGGGGVARGAVWVLFLNSDGTVKSHRKIGSAEGGFTGTLDDGDLLGISLAFVGDVDGDAIGDVAVGADCDDDGGPDRGAVWVMFLNTDGTVKAHQKISDTEGGFTGGLDDLDRFGGGVGWGGDLDCDGVQDLLVGAHLDDDGGLDRGAVWLLSLNTDGTVKGHQKISDTSGGFTGGLGSSDQFGTGPALIDDLDGDGRRELCVGNRLDDDGGTDRGAVWVVFLTGCLVDPTTVDFGTVLLGSSRDTTFTIVNGGCAAIAGTVTESIVRRF